MGVLFVIFAIAMAAATFIENDFGSSAAYNMVYDSWWFELILLLLSINLVGQLITFKLFKKTRITGALFHLSFIVMIIGAGITRYFGWEGTIHIREGQVQNKCYSTEKYIGYSVKDNTGKVLDMHHVKYNMTNISADNFDTKININNKDYQLVLSKIIPNASEVINDNPAGVPMVSLVLTKDMMSQDNLLIKKGGTRSYEGLTFSFDASTPGDINISDENGNFMISSPLEMGEMSMGSHDIKTLTPGEKVEMSKMEIYTINDIKIIPQTLTESGIESAVAVNPAQQQTGQNAFIFHIYGGDRTETVYLWDRSTDMVASDSCNVDGRTVVLTYGSKVAVLPFYLKLNDFIIDRYPGSNSPSGYKSDVVLMDKKAGIEKPFVIFMNNILKYKGYRFYQSSFDRDEKGTILSVNHDMAGMMVTYTGYALLFFFIILTLINRNSVFHKVTAGYWQSNLRKTVTALAFIMLLSGLSSASAQKLEIGKSVADEFGKVLVQDQKGRTKPLFTLSNDILRKVARKNNFKGLSSMQVFLGIYLDFNDWKDVPLIRVSSRELQKKIGIKGKYASFSDLVDLSGNGTYKISADVNLAYSKAPGDRSKLDKEVMKVDERLNIVYMIYKGDFLKMFPLKDGTHNWGSPEEALKHAVSKEDSLYLSNIMPVLTNALETNNIADTRDVTRAITQYQERFAGYELPSAFKTNAELLYYRMGIFEKLFPFYATVGLIMLISLITMVIRGKKKNSILIKVLSWLLFGGFLFHTFGLALRWYIAGHSPMSNGYESMIFISWVTLLAGFIFSRKSAFALSSTAVLGSMTLMVAHLSFMDPEITNLVPVLKSYWLTLHVSVITGSYGFLGLGAILGIITLILISLSNQKNRERISATVDELTVINYKTLTLGLYFITIGTFLGAVWANESWGRYWGWDPKETWSLITIVIYSLVIHSRLIPGLKDVYSFNLLSLFAFSTVLMTYFGVNYYLSGMHSYAAGDPVPVPSFVYISILVLAVLSVMAYYKYAGWKNKDNELKK